MIASRDQLRRWLAATIAGGDIPFPEGDDGEGRLLMLAEEEGVVCLLYDRLHASTSLRTTLADPARSRVAVELARQWEASQILAALANAGIRALVLKGTALAYWLYEHPAQRTRGDFDLLVEDAAHALAAADVLRQSGYDFDGPGVESASGFEAALQRATTGGLTHRIDLHWRLINNAALTHGLDFEMLWKDSIPILQLHRYAKGLGKVHALAHALMHRVTNMPYGQSDRLIWLYDIHLLACCCSELEWSDLVQLCRDKSIASPCLSGLLASRAAFGTVIQKDAEAALLQLVAAESWRLDAMNEGSLERLHLAALPRPQKIAWLRRKLFPSREFMRYRYGTTGTVALVQAYLVRWWVGIRRGLGG